MRNKGVVIVLTVVITFLCLFYLQFTLVSRRVQADAVAKSTDAAGNVNLGAKQRYLDSLWNKPVHNFLGIEYTYKEVKENELSLGLDLQGGMHVVLEVSPVDIIRGLSNNPRDPQFNQLLQAARETQKNSQGSFVDIFYAEFKNKFPDKKLSDFFASAKGSISISDDDQTILNRIKAEVDDAINRSFTILKTRIDQFGTSSPNIQKLPATGRIQIEIPGADNPQRVRKLLQGVARLEFWTVVEFSDPSLLAAMESINSMLLKEQTERLAQEKAAEPVKKAESKEQKSDANLSALEQQLNKVKDSTGTALDSIRNAGNSPLYALMTPGAGFMYDVKDTSTINNLLRRPDVRALLPRNIGYFWDVKVNPDVTPNVEDLALNFVEIPRNGKPLLTGEVIVDARQDFDQYGKYSVSMRMNASGSKSWAKITSEASSQNPQRRIAIVLDNFVYSAPTVQGEIPNGNSQITGSFTQEEAKDLATALKAGSLPAPTRIVEEMVVGPTLGQVAQNQGLISMGCGLLIVVLFMVAYYSKGGMVANISLLFNIFFILGIMAQPQLHTALTLPGIAGIVLTMGMAVDANVLIFERIKEEVAEGRKLVEAVNLGFSRAFASIFDSNLTTFLTAAFLFILGQGPIKGFAITLMIGISTSFFSAVYISRVIIEWMMRKGEASKISFTTSLQLVPKGMNFDFLGKRRLAYLFSASVIVVGLLLIAVRGLNLGVDFKGGRSYVVSFTQPVDATAMRNSLSTAFDGKGTEVKNYGSSSVMRVTTSYLIDDESDQADEKVKAALVAGVKKHTGLEFSEQESGLNDKRFSISSSTKVGATIADDIKDSAFEAGLFSILGIFLYILVRFRKWQYSTGAIVALIHDTLFTFSIFAIADLLGFTLEIDQVFVAALLTIIGYSINDTVIIFDRIREYTNFGSFKDEISTFNAAINNTMSRTLITSGTTLIVVTVLLFFGGEVLRGFSFALFIGIVIGTYSSVFIAAPIVIDFNKSRGSLKS
ncbi:MAG: protein translocase subunit SecDF [Bacteroidetes bacterium]|nr:protein translocase subunit SecDF [Bacteroidota bacterium]